MLRFVLQNGVEIETPGEKLTSETCLAMTKECGFKMKNVVQIWYPDEDYGGETHLSGAALDIWLDRWAGEND